MSFYRSFYSQCEAPTAKAMRQRVRRAIEVQRQAVATCGRRDIAELIRTGTGGWDDRLWQIRSELNLYRAVNAAEHAHARGEHLDRWALYPVAA